MDLYWHYFSLEKYPYFTVSADADHSGGKKYRLKDLNWYSRFSNRKFIEKNINIGQKQIRMVDII
jgi:hypothetical protein